MRMRKALSSLGECDAIHLQVPLQSERSDTRTVQKAGGMRVKPNVKRKQKFSTDLLFVIEQWIALAVGIACLAVFLWSVLDGHKAFSIKHTSHISAATLLSTGWLLTIALGILGVTLTRFAFHRHSEVEPDEKSRTTRVQIASGDSTGNPNHFHSLVLNKRRG